jgi:SAM-dependent methyltransferase
MTSPTPDLYGRALLEYLKGRRLPVHLRRGDGRLLLLDLKPYFSGPGLLTPMERCLFECAHGTVLDLGAGGGRIAFHLKEMAERGQGTNEVVAVDPSQGACACLRRLGLRTVVHGPWQRVMESGIWRGRFDAVVLAGGNLGLAGDLAGLSVMLDWIRGILRVGGIVLATGFCPMSRDDDCRQVRLRIEYAGKIGEWFTWLTLTPAVLERAAGQQGLRVTRWLMPPDPLEFGAQLVKI